MQHQNLGLHRYAVFVSVCTLILLVAGAMVTSTGSGLSVPDWPTTLGQNPFTFPFSQWVGNIKFEHSHRLIASAVGLLTLVLAAWAWRVEKRPVVRKLALAAAVLVVVQGLFGGLTVLLLLPPSVSIIHAALAQSFFCVMVGIALVTSPAWQNAESVTAPDGGLTRVAGWLFGSAFVQLLVGAYLRHTGTGLSIHIAVAILVAGLGVSAFLSVRKMSNPPKYIRLHGRGGLHLILFQLILGGATLALLRYDWAPEPRPLMVPITTSIHLVMGALVLANSLLLALWTRRLYPLQSNVKMPEVTRGAAP